MQPIQIVLDTNVIVTGLRSSKGSAFRLLQEIGTGLFDINISVPLVLEYEDVLLRQLPELFISEADVNTLLDYYCAVGNRHSIYYLWRPTLRDPADEMVLELAVKARCDYIISFNKRDFDAASVFGILVLTPLEFMKRIGVIK